MSAVEEQESGPGTVAYLGPEGTFTHIVARQRFGEGARLTPCESIEGVFEAVLQGASSRGIVPIENTSGGTIYNTVDLLIKHAGAVFVQEELALNVQLVLVGHAGQRVETVYSHFVPLEHFDTWLKARHPGAKRVNLSSTAVAARRAVKDERAAAFASRDSAALYGLDILETPEDPEGTGVNITQFFVIGPELRQGLSEARTGLLVALKDRPGSLCAFLQPFAREGINLTRIVSRSVRGQLNTYCFFVELEGADTDPRLGRVLKEVAEVTQSITTLGHYPKGATYDS